LKIVHFFKNNMDTDLDLILTKNCMFNIIL